jgi:hypothetical protein
MVSAMADEGEFVFALQFSLYIFYNGIFERKAAAYRYM